MGWVNCSEPGIENEKFSLRSSAGTGPKRYTKNLKFRSRRIGNFHFFFFHVDVEREIKKVGNVGKLVDRNSHIVCKISVCDPFRNLDVVHFLCPLSCPARFAFLTLFSIYAFHSSISLHPRAMHVRHRDSHTKQVHHSLHGSWFIRECKKKGCIYRS